MEVEQGEIAPSIEAPVQGNPAPLEQEVSASSLKRRRSESATSAGKRRRTSQSPHEEHRRPSIDESARDARRHAPPPRRPSGGIAGGVEERKRGARLFGGILGVLSKNKTAKVNEKRVELEKKQQEKLKSQAVQYSEDRPGRYGRVGGTENSEQAMRHRHARLLKMAGYLQTGSTPRIHYKPWKLLPDEERKIKSQIAQAEDTIDRELREWEANKDARARDQESTNQDRRRSEDHGNDKIAAEADSRMEEDTVGNAASMIASESETTKPPAQEVQLPSSKEKDDVDDVGEGGDVIMETGEDTVIY